MTSEAPGTLRAKPSFPGPDVPSAPAAPSRGGRAPWAVPAPARGWG